MKKIMFLLIFASVIISCKTVKPAGDKNAVTLDGKIEKIEMSTFQYGTHLLKKDGRSYALRTSTVKLDDFTNKDVIVKGVKVEGYPVENGPELIDVKEIKVK